MEYRLLGRSGLKISLLTFGTMTFGGESVFAKTGSIGVARAQRQAQLTGNPRAADLSRIAPYLRART